MLTVQGTTIPGRPWHLWAIGIVGSLWSSIGVVSFILTQMKVEAVMSQFPPEQRQYFESFPWWAVAFWALNVIGSLIGSVLLLLKSRFAFHVLLASLLGALVTNLGGLFLLGGLEVMGGTNALGLTAIPIVFAAALVFYARAMTRNGVLGAGSGKLTTTGSS